VVWPQSSCPRRRPDLRPVVASQRWSILGDADEVRKSDERRKIVAALKEAGEEQTPTAIAKLTGMKVENVRVLIRKMVKDGEVIQPRVGYYTAPFPC